LVIEGVTFWNPLFPSGAEFLKILVKDPCRHGLEWLPHENERRNAWKIKRRLSSLSWRSSFLKET